MQTAGLPGSDRAGLTNGQGSLPQAEPIYPDESRRTMQAFDAAQGEPDDDYTARPDLDRTTRDTNEPGSFQMAPGRYPRRTDKAQLTSAPPPQQVVNATPEITTDAVLVDPRTAGPVGIVAEWRVDDIPEAALLSDNADPSGGVTLDLESELAAGEAWVRGFGAHALSEEPIEGYAPVQSAAPQSAGTLDLDAEMAVSHHWERRFGEATLGEDTPERDAKPDDVSKADR